MNSKTASDVRNDTNTINSKAIDTSPIAIDTNASTSSSSSSSSSNNNNSNSNSSNNNKINNNNGKADPDADVDTNANANAGVSAEAAEQAATLTQRTPARRSLQQSHAQQQKQQQQQQETQQHQQERFEDDKHRFQMGRFERPDRMLLQQPVNMAAINFNSEEFLSRVNINDKINNILRSPNKTPNGVRQRSVFTAITPSATPISSRFNAGAAPFITQQQRLAALPINPAANGSGAATNTPKDSNGSTSNGNSMRGMPIMLHNSLHHLGGTYEAPMTTRSLGITRTPYSAHSHNRYPVSSSSTYGYEADVCRMGQLSPNSTVKQFPQPMPPPSYAMCRLSANHRLIEYEMPNMPPCPGSGPIAMSNGTIQLRLRDGIRVDMTLDKAVRVLNQRSMVAIALSRTGSNSALIHPNGRVLQNGSKVEIVTYDGMKTNNYVRYAKMWYKGVSFTSESCALIYLVDTAGTRTTTDTFTDLTKDYTLTIFYDDSRHGPSFVQDANEIIASSSYTCTDEGTEIYEINGFRITQAADGLVKLTRTYNKCLIRTSPGNGSATLTTPGIHCTASLGKTSHLFVRRNEKRMHFDGSCFIVRNAGHSAGFNENNLLIVY